MTAPLLSSIVAVLFACLGYAVGRAHQWRRGAWEREQAYRDGYDEATRSTLSMAARIAGPAQRDGSAEAGPDRPPAAGDAVPADLPPSGFPAPAGPPVPPPAASDAAFFEPVVHEMGPATEVPVPRLGRRGRHYVPDELVRAATYRLSPDRVARAKVPGAAPPPDQDAEDDAPRNPVPKPRSS
jgi:hypothetical protein